MRLLRRLGNPIATEAAAFRWLIFLGTLAFAITGLTLLLRAVF